MRLHIIRHADPDYGRDDLTAMGKAQARALAQYTESLPLVRIISSPKGRAQATARPTAEQSGLPIEVMPWLRELDQLRTDYDSDNLHNPVVIWDLPGHVLKAVENEGETSSRFPQPLTAERFDELRQGWNTLLGELGVTSTPDGLTASDRLGGHDVALFCHHGVGLALLSIITGIPVTAMWRSFWLPPASVTTVLLEQYERSRINPRLLCVGDTRHLNNAICANTSGIIYNIR